MVQVLEIKKIEFLEKLLNFKRRLEVKFMKYFYEIHQKPITKKVFHADLKGDFFQP